jgi:transposase
LICRRVLDEGWTIARAAEAAGCSERTAAKWLGRYRDGDRQLLDRSSRPRRSPYRLPPERVRAIEVLRRLRMTAAEIAEILALPLSTVSLWLKRIGLGKRSRLDPFEPPNRYERRHPGELVHVDIKRADEPQRLLLSLMPTGRRSSSGGASCGSDPADHAPTATPSASSKHLNESAYARIYGSSQQRTAAPPSFLRRHNFERPHGSLSHQTPASRLNNVVGNYT